MRLEPGLIHVYTGNGKGKTTASLGLAFRAMGHDLKVVMLQFMKGDSCYGECHTAAKLSNFTLIQSGLPTFVDKDNPSEEDLRLAAEGLKKAREILESGEYDLVILDEINVAYYYNLIGLDDIKTLIDLKKPGTELVLTGRYAHPDIIERADLVTEMKEIKHYYDKGKQMREGIDF